MDQGVYARNGNFSVYVRATTLVYGVFFLGTQCWAM
jgi:hypothetical protein